MDTIRGIALLGILLMNIVGFGLYKAYSDPTNSGGADGWNLKVWWMNAMFFEGTTRGMFSMLFGAGVILFTSRAASASLGVSVTDAYFRRILWLVLFGIIHSYLLLWHGEILYPYAICGLFAFSFRHWNPKRLIIGGLVLCALTTAEYTKDYIVVRHQSEAAQLAQAHEDAGGKLSNTDEDALAEWEGVISDRKTTPESI